MPPEYVKLMKRVAKARGEDLSDFVRRAVYKELAELDFLSEEHERALGLKRIQKSKETDAGKKRSHLHDTWK